MTTNFELIDKAKDLKIKNFKGVFMRDEILKKEKEQNECFILNLNDSKVSDKENENTGHWTAVFKKNNEKYYFCSYGSPPPKEVIEYLGKPIMTHNFCIQPFNSSICGELSLLFLKLMDDDLTYYDTVLTLLEMFDEMFDEMPDEKEQQDQQKSN